MREVLRDLGIPQHIGLAYDAWAPVADNGKVPDADSDRWFSELANLKVPPDYRIFYERWRASFQRSGDRLAKVTLASRLLVGHGNASATDVGLTVHHTWGVPIIPGSALKGLLAHYVDTVYGPDDPTRSPHDPEIAERDRSRAPYQGVVWRDRYVQHGPGEVYRGLFGAPDAPSDRTYATHSVGACRGLVVFHDAVFVSEGEGTENPFVQDVLTVHQKSYYDGRGASLPSDYDAPNPVSFLTVRPGTQFLVALSGREDWTALTSVLLRDALQKWGIGGKTSAGYGRIKEWRLERVAPPPPRGELATFVAWLEDTPLLPGGNKAPQRDVLRQIKTEWLDRLRRLEHADRAEATQRIKRVLKSPKVTEERDALLTQLLEPTVP